MHADLAPHLAPGPYGRSDCIDLLRGLSIAAVILLHIRIMFVLNSIPVGAALPAWLRYLLFNNGGNGVTMFFAISGFLITTTSIRRFGSLTHMQPRRFYRIRFARIAPPLLLLLAVLSVLHLANVHEFHIHPEVGTLPRALFVALTFQLNWFEAQHGYLPPVWSVLWSLSIEEMFYLFFPLACLALLAFNRFRHSLGTTLFATALVAFVIVGPLARTSWSTNEVWLGQNYLAGMSDITLGCLSALLTHRLLQARTAPRSALLNMATMLGIGLLLVVTLWPLDPHPVRFFLGHTGLDDTTLSLATCLIMGVSVLRTANKSRTNTSHASSKLLLPLRWFGRYSYELYLTHEFLVIWGVALYRRLHTATSPAGGLSITIWVLAILLATAPLGFLLAHFVSEPLNRRLRGATLPQQLRAGSP